MEGASFQGKLFIFTAPSGAGKTTIVKHILKKYDHLGFSVSATTRDKRAHETHGQDYYFIPVDDFKKKIADGAFIEWEEVYSDQFYGTLQSEVDRIWGQGKHLVFDIDVRGAKNIKSTYGDRCMAVFVRPPSVHTLIERLKNRNTETPESLEKRISKVKKEMEYENCFDFTLVNDILEISFLEAEHIVETFSQRTPAYD
ncbi:MAG: guanylate kinase [Saprospiraceae bacterium]